MMRNILYLFLVFTDYVVSFSNIGYVRKLQTNPLLKNRSIFNSLNSYDDGLVLNAFNNIDADFINNIDYHTYYNIFIIANLILSYFIFYTPEYITNKINTYFGIIELKYITSDFNIVKYKFDHQYYDGELMALTIKNNGVKPYYAEPIKYGGFDIKNNKFEDYQYVKSGRILNYSLFTSAVATILKTIFSYQDRDEIKVAVVVSTRHFLKKTDKIGNYIKWAVYTVNKNHSLEEICDIHQQAVRNIKDKKPCPLNTTFKDFLMLKDISYVFDSWRSLTHINTEDNLHLRRINEFEISKEKVDEFFKKDIKVAIILDFLDKNYIISSIVKFLEDK